MAKIACYDVIKIRDFYVVQHNHVNGIQSQNFMNVYVRDISPRFMFSIIFSAYCIAGITSLYSVLFDCRRI